MNTTTNSYERRYDLDWLRLIAIVILLFFHTGMWFNHWDWHDATDLIKKITRMCCNP